MPFVHRVKSLLLLSRRKQSRAGAGVREQQ
uniref:Uncharacterized protein n=1 Tax=Anopheles albimanus TaxID=7167 RepID=A0A182FZA7_ANOAL